MKEQEFKLLTEKGLLVIRDYPEKVSKEDLNMRAILRIELAQNFGINLEDCFGITSGFVMDFFTWLNDQGKLKTQPFFPKLLPVDSDMVNVANLIRKEDVLDAWTIEHSVLVKIISSSKKCPDPIELQWLCEELEDGPNRIMVKFLATNLKNGRIKAGRKERREFMKELEQYLPTTQTNIMVDYWKKLAMCIHPSDYSEYPNAQQFFFSLVSLSSKIDPEKPKLMKLMWKGWETGKDFEVFESYLDQNGLTPRDFLTSIQDYERNPRVSRWKKTGEVELGRENPREEESDVVDLILFQLKEKFLRGLKPKEVNLIIPPMFYDIPAYSILREPIMPNEYSLESDIVGFRMICPENVSIITFNLDGEYYGNGTTWRINNIDNFFIVGCNSGGWDINLILTFFKEEQRVAFSAGFYISEKVKSLILFGYDSSTRTLKWIGEPSRTFYAGTPHRIEDWRKVWKAVTERKPILSLGELAERMYHNVEESDFTEELTVKKMREDLGI